MHVSKAEERAITKRLRYLHAENIAKDFKSQRERAAIAAVFKWLAFNTIVARPLKRSGHYATNRPWGNSRAARKAWKESEYGVIENAVVKEAEETLGISEPIKHSIKKRRA
jgi:hypothetical protein